MPDVLRPFQEFVRLEASSGLLLMAAALAALVWANSAWAEHYFALWQATIRLGIAEVGLTKTLMGWINDGLMALFFVVVGLEIKREILGGELSDLRKAILPIAAAIGGMAAPAAFYLALNIGSAGARGWGVPMATDIAFALGVLALVGRHAPVGLKVFLTALAIVDDIGAVLVIAIFYSGSLSLTHLAGAGAVLVILLIANRAGLQNLAVYMLLGAVLWIMVYQSGVHATVAGVLLALTVPSQGANHSPMRRLEHRLHPWVTYAVLPVFALANAGVTLTAADIADPVSIPIALGILAGLVLGKQVGITLATWLAVKLRIATLPTGAGWSHIYGAAWLGGIGFTMSIFVAGLAFAGTSFLDTAKLSIFAASAIAGLVGWLILRNASIDVRRRRAPSLPRMKVGADAL